MVCRHASYLRSFLMALAALVPLAAASSQEVIEISSEEVSCEGASLSVQATTLSGVVAFSIGVDKCLRYVPSAARE